MFNRLSAWVLALVFVGMCGAAGKVEAASRTVCASGCMYTDLQAAIDAAAFGDVILLRAGETYVGHYVLRAKSGSGFIQIRSDAADSSLPGPGVRLVPSDRPGGNTARTLLPRLIGRGGAYKTMPLLRTEPNAHGYIIKFIEFDGVAHVGYETLIQMGEDTTVASSYDITFDRVYVHGDPYRGQKRGITLNAARIAVVNSYISDIKAVNADSQAIAGWNGAGPFTIENNFLEAAGENILFGGSDPAVSKLVPSNITISRNHFYKPLAWRNAILPAPGGARAVAGGSGSLASGTHYFTVVAVMATGTRTVVSAPSAQVSATVGGSGAATVSWSRVPGADKYRVYRGTTSGSQTRYLETTATSFLYTGASEVSGTPASSGTKWVVKNSFELKNAAHVTVDGNLFENCWAAGQSGYALMLTPRNSGNAPWTRVQDVTFTNNIVRRVAGVVNVAGYDNTDPTMRTERIAFRNNLFEVDHVQYGTNAKAILLGDGAASITFDRNTIIHTNSAVVYAYGAAMPGFVYTNNISQHHTYGIMGQGTSMGNPTIAAFFPGAVVRCNVLAGGKASLYPTPNGFPTTAQWTASFVDPAQGDYTVIPGSAVALAGCNGSIPGADLAAIDSAMGSQGDPSGTPPPPPPPASNQPPVADAGGPYSAAVGTLVSVSGSGSRDPDGSVLDYRWYWGDDVLVRAGELPASARRGSEWVRTSAADAAGGAVLENPDRGAAKRAAPLASPSSYVEFTVNVAAGVPYRLWMRLRAPGNGGGSDSLYVQFSGAVTAQGTAVARIGTTAGLPMILEQGHGAGISGWGWTDSAWDATAAPIYFAQGGLQTVRLQAREDGVQWDQLVLSSAAYTTAPGAAKNDTTLVDPDLGTATGVSAAHRYGSAGTYPVLLVVTDSAGAAATDTATVTVGGPGGSSGNQPPVADAGGPYSAAVGAQLSVSGSGSNDPDGATLNYRWYWGDDVLVRAGELPASARRGSEWVRSSAAGAAGGAVLENPDRGAAKRAAPLASPSSYVEFTVNVAAGVPYRLWMRLRAPGNGGGSDSLYVQFSGAVTAQGTAVARIGTTAGLPMILEQGHGAGISGWGWTDSAWDATAAPIYFAQGGLQTVRLQAREDGVQWDQLVLSSAAFTTAPGAAKNDTTFVDPDLGTATGVSAAHRYSSAGTFPVLLVVTDGAGAAATDTATATVR